VIRGGRGRRRDREILSLVARPNRLQPPPTEPNRTLTEPQPNPELKRRVDAAGPYPTEAAELAEMIKAVAAIAEEEVGGVGGKGK
jgi:hypothetical protein